MARQKKTIQETLTKKVETIVKYTKRHPWARNVWIAVLFLGSVYFVYRFIAPMIFR